MPAARAAARNKPILVIKAGRFAEGARAAASHTGALAGADDVFDAAIRRAGMLRVFETDEMFDAVETLACARSLRDDLDPDDAAFLIIGLVQGLAAGWSLGGRDFDLTEERNRLLELQPSCFAWTPATAVAKRGVL